MKSIVLAAAIVATGLEVASAQSPAPDRLQVYQAEMRRCVRYYLSDGPKGQALAQLGIQPDDLCRRATPAFVSGLSDQESAGLYRSEAGWTPSIINRFLKSGEICVHQLSR